MSHHQRPDEVERRKARKLETDIERTRMFATLVQAGYRVRNACAAWNRVNGNRHVSPMVFSRLNQRYQRTGIIHPQRRERVKPVLVGRRDEVLQRFRENGRQGCKRVANAMDIGKQSVKRILKTNGFKPYKKQTHQVLLPPDLPQRLNFSDWVRQQLVDDENILADILFTDESTFTSNGVCNKQNDRLWAEGNPHWMEQLPVHGFKINVWAGVVGDTIIGPIYFIDNLNAQLYLGLINRLLPRFLRNLPIDIRNRLFFMQDGAPAHTAAVVIRRLRRLFPGRLISRQGDIIWPSRSPDLNLLDSFVWPHVKNKVYVRRYQDVELLIVAIQRAFETITPAMLRNARRNLLNKIREVPNQQGGHVEHVLH